MERGSSLPSAVSKPGQFSSPHFACVFLEAVGPFYLLSPTGSKISITGVNCIICLGLTMFNTVQ